MIKNINEIKFDDESIWTVASIKTGTEDEIEKYTKKYSDIIEYASPEYHEIEYIGGKKVEEDKLIFPGYLFVRIVKNSNIWKLVEIDIKYINRFLTYTSKKYRRIIANIEEYEFDKVKEIFGKINDFNVGSRVVIKSGLFKDLEGKIITKGNIQVKILLDQIRRHVQLDIDNLKLK